MIVFGSSLHTASGQDLWEGYQIGQRWVGGDRWNEPGAWREFDTQFRYMFLWNEDWQDYLPVAPDTFDPPRPWTTYLPDSVEPNLPFDEWPEHAHPVFTNSGSSTPRVDSSVLGKNHWEIWGLSFRMHPTYEFIEGDYEMVELLDENDDPVLDEFGNPIILPVGTPPSYRVTYSPASSYTIVGNPIYVGEGGINNMSGTVQNVDVDIWLWDDMTIYGGVGLWLGGSEINNSRDGANTLTFEGWTHVGSPDGSGPVIRGDGNVAFSSPGTFLFVPNEYTGDTVFDSGNVMIGSDSAFGVGGVIQVFGVGNRISAFANPVQISNNFELYGDINFGGTTFMYDSGGPITITGDFNILDDDRTITTEHGTTTTITGLINTNDHALRVYNYGSSALALTGTILGDSAAPRSLIKDGPGLLRLGSANSFFGDITTRDGTLQIAHAEAFANAQVFNVEGRTFMHSTVPFTIDAQTRLSDEIHFTQGQPITFDEEILVLAPSTLRMFNTQSPTTITENSRINLSSNLLIAGPGHLHIDGPIIGTGNVTKTGQGQLWLGGDSTFSGTTTVSGGGVMLHNYGNLPGNVSLTDSYLAIADGSAVQGNVHVGRNAQLTGSGRVGGNVTVASHGSIAPGQSIGTITIDGNATWNSGSTAVFEFDTLGNSDKIIVGGDATIQQDARFFMQQIGGGFISGNNQFNILEANTLNIADIEELVVPAISSPFLSFEVMLDEIANGNLIVISQRTPFHGIAVGRDNQAIARQLDLLAENATDQQAIELLTAIDSSLDNDAFNSSLQQLSPALYAGLVETSFEYTRSFNRNLHDQLRNARLGRSDLEYDPFAAAMRSAARQRGYGAYNTRDLRSNSNPSRLEDERETRWNVFATGTGLFDRIDSTSERTGLRSSSGGVIAGVDYSFTEQFFVGLTGGYAHSDIDFRDARGDGTVDTFRVGPYAGLTLENLSLNAAFTYGHHSHDHDVRVNLPNFQQEKNADFNASDSALHFDASLDVPVRDEFTIISPVFALDYIHYRRDGFTESGGGATNLRVDSETIKSLQSTLGLRLEQRFFSDGPIFILGGFGGWSYEFLADDNNVTARFADLPQSFTVEGPGPDRHVIRAGVGARALFTNNMQAYLNYNGRFSSNQDAHGVNLGLSFQF